MSPARLVPAGLATGVVVLCIARSGSSIGKAVIDPTHNSLSGEHHIRVAVGRDYADVPPTRGVFKGLSSVRSELAVGVSVGTTPGYTGDPARFTPWMSREATAPLVDQDSQQQQQ